MSLKNILLIVACTLTGLIAGYLVFGKWGGEYVSFNTLFSFGGNAFQRAFHSISGIEDMRANILMCGGAGAVLGVLLSFKPNK
jgi:hypothetical protein